MAEDLRFELAILATVQGFYQKLLRDTLGGDVPIPSGLDADALRHSDRELPNTLSRMYRWLHLLDMAITPAMLRQALTPDTDSEVAEALLRYFVRRREPSDVNRDKTDLIATFLYRHPRVPGQWEQRGYGLDGALPLSPFEIALIEILADSDVPSLPEEHVQLLRRFDPFLQEVSRFRDFNALIDSAMIGRVRELKQWLDSSFYHPGVLATVSAYNAAFGQKFDELFVKALTEIKTFGQALEEMGGTILTTVDGVEVTVEHVAAIEEKQLLQADYGSTRKVPPCFQAKEGTGSASSDPAVSPDTSRATLSSVRRSWSRAQNCQGRATKSARRNAGFSAARNHRAAALCGGEQTSEGGRIDSRFRARRRSKISPGRSDALLQPDADQRLRRTPTGRLSLKRRLHARMLPGPDSAGFGFCAHQHRTGRTEA